MKSFAGYWDTIGHNSFLLHRHYSNIWRCDRNHVPIHFQHDQSTLHLNHQAHLTTSGNKWLLLVVLQSDPEKACGGSTGGRSKSAQVMIWETPKESITKAWGSLVCTVG